MTGAWDKFADRCTTWLAGPVAFALGVCAIGGWLVTGPDATFVDGLTAFTFLLGLVLLADSARSTAALHVKLDAMIKASDANNDLIAVETRTADEIAAERDRLQSDVTTSTP